MLEGNKKVILFQSLDATCKIRLTRAPSTLAVNTSREGEPVTFLGIYF